MDTCQYTLSVEIPYGLVIVSSPNYDHNYRFKIGKTLISGKVVEYYSNGNKGFECNYKDGKRDGLSIGWYENGNKWYEHEYKNGELEGLSINWWVDDSLWYERIYKNDVMVSEKLYD